MTGTLLVTGGARRLGRAIAENLRAAGYQVLTPEHAVLDLADAAAIAHFAEGLDGAPLAGLVNNAAIFESDDIDTVDAASFERHQRINVLAPLLLIQALRPNLEKGNGSVVNILDHNIENPNIDFLSYKLSKFAMAGATRILARSLAPRIRVNGVAPGLTLPSFLQTEAEFAAIHDRVPLGKGTTPEDVSAAVRYLIEAPAVTGQILFVDGGERFLARKRDVSLQE